MSLSTRSAFVKLAVFVPESHADELREAMGAAGAGRIGNYSFCSFSMKGFGRFRPESGSCPTLGTQGTLEVVPEERIEVLCSREKLSEVLQAMKAAHPYEEVAYDIYPLENE
jgi:hypothetical protein